MYFQAPAIQLLDAIYRAANDTMAEVAPESFSDAYLKVLLEPLSPEARVWINSNFDHFGDNIHYEIFRPLGSDDYCDLILRKQYYLEASRAIAYLFETNRRRAVLTKRKNASANRLKVVFQAPRERQDFLNLYIAVAGNSENANMKSLQSAIRATRQTLKHYNPYYYIDD